MTGRSERGDVLTKGEGRVWRDGMGATEDPYVGRQFVAPAWMCPWSPKGQSMQRRMT